MLVGILRKSLEKQWSLPYFVSAIYRKNLTLKNYKVDIKRLKSVLDRETSFLQSSNSNYSNKN